MKTLLLMRHSLPEPGKADAGLSAAGIRRAETVFQNPVFCDVSGVWASPARRAVQTAELLGLPVVTDGRLLERRTGDTSGQDASFWRRQYEDPDFKNPDGESFREVRARMSAALAEILHEIPDGGSGLVVSHAAAICAFLQRFCTVDVTDETQKLRRITFQGKIILDGKFEPAGCFVLRIDEWTHAVCALERCAAI